MPTNAAPYLKLNHPKAATQPAFASFPLVKNIPIRCISIEQSCLWTHLRFQ